MSSRERELAQSQISAEEKKRQLEKLTREQQELREQAERMGRQLDAAGQEKSGASASPQNSPRPAGSAGQRGQPAGAQGAGGGEIRDAAEQMRGATSELQRQDPSAAAGRAARAAEQLRQMEERLRSGGPGGSERANGDLRLEAQQLAEAERRIADEAARLGKDDQAGRRGHGGAAASRR